jgi:hypothetical protein
MPPPSESARLATSSTCTGRPASRLAFIAAPRAMLRPITRAFGKRPLTAAATPAASPPPESGTSTVAASGIASAISSPSVPCPATTAASSKGGTMTRPSSATRRSTSSCASSCDRPTMHTFAPSRRISATLFSGTSRDMQIVASAPSALAAWASARP